MTSKQAGDQRANDGSFIEDASQGDRVLPCRTECDPSSSRRDSGGANRGAGPAHPCENDDGGQSKNPPRHPGDQAIRRKWDGNGEHCCEPRCAPRTGRSIWEVGGARGVFSPVAGQSIRVVLVMRALPAQCDLQTCTTAPETGNRPGQDSWAARADRRGRWSLALQLYRSPQLAQNGQARVASGERLAGAM